MKFKDRLRAIFGLKYISEESWEDLADTLVEGDLGAVLADSITGELKALCEKEKIRDGENARKRLKELLLPWIKTTDLGITEGSLNIFMLLGVNGTGKTSTAAKLANRYKGKPILAAADTFRAAAIDQLKVHGGRLGLRVVAHEQGADPGAVIFDAIEAARAASSELLIVDTAGRMHTKENLVRELAKMDKIISGRGSGILQKRILVLDATTGQNALRQAEVFSQSVKLDAFILTKYDSGARGGAALAVMKNLGIPIAFICNGEKYESIEPMNPSDFLDDFLGLSV